MSNKNESPTADKPTARPCSNCRRQPVYARERCNTCLRYFNSHGLERPARLYRKILGRHERDKPRWCRNCGDPSVYSNRRCNACRIYYERHKRERPKHLWDVDACCKTCGVPLATVTGAKAGYCDPCYHYDRQGKQRPRHLWGIGEFGWCACGRPATREYDDFGVCAVCAEAAT